MTREEFAEVRGLEIFAPGTWKGKTWTAEDLKRMAASFAATKGAFPTGRAVVFDHESELGPRVGSLVDVRYEERPHGPRLVGDIVDIPDYAKEGILGGAWPDRSIERLIKPFPWGGQEYRDVIVRLAFLGAAIPAVKGLAPPSQAEWHADPADTEAVTLPAELFAETPDEPPWSQVNPERSMTADEIPDSVYAWVPEDGPKSARRFPYKWHTGGQWKIHRGGVRAALAAIKGARTGQDLTRRYPGALAKLQAAARQLGMEGYSWSVQEAPPHNDTPKEDEMEEAIVNTLQERIKELEAERDAERQKFAEQLEGREAEIASQREKLEAELTQFQEERQKFAVVQFDAEVERFKADAAASRLPAAVIEAQIRVVRGLRHPVETERFSDEEDLWQVFRDMNAQLAKSGLVPEGEVSGDPAPSQTDEQAEFLAHAKAVTGDEFGEVQAAEERLGYTLADWRE